MFMVCSVLNSSGKKGSQLFKCPSCGTTISVTTAFCPNICVSCSEDVPDIDLLDDPLDGKMLRALMHIDDQRFYNAIITHYQEEVAQGHMISSNTGDAYGYGLDDAEFDALNCGRGIYPARRSSMY